MLILKNKEEVQIAFQELKERLNEEKLQIDINRINKEKQTKYKTSFSIDITVNEQDKTKLTNLLTDLGFVLENNTIIYVGKIPAKIMIDNNMTIEEYQNKYQAILYINKKRGMTSFDVVKKIMDLFSLQRVGHTGTLDPLAEGVLIITLNKATKVGELLTAKDKEYIAGVELGYETDTYDSTGTILKQKEVPELLPIEKTLKTFQKTYLQEVPIYSAIKVNGKKLYEYARNKEEVSLPKKEVTIKEIELLNKTDKTFTFKTLVTKGCYIRSLIHDIGIELGTYATMTKLTRTKQGSISIEEANTLEELEKGIINIHSIEEVLNIPIITLDDELTKKVSNGVPINNIWNIKDKAIMKDKIGNIIGIVENNSNKLKTWKNF
jgi:tRNA pseudouridine55 synthase